MVKCCFMSDGKLHVVLGITNESVVRMLVNDPLVTDLSFAGENYGNIFLVMYDDEATPEAKLTRVVRDIRRERFHEEPYKRGAAVLSMGVLDGEWETLKNGGRIKFDPSDVVPSVGSVMVFQGETEEKIREFLTQAGFIREGSKVIGSPFKINPVGAPTGRFPTTEGPSVSNTPKSR